MSVDISGLSIAELEQLAVAAKARVEVLKRQQFAEVRRSLEAQAKEAWGDRKIPGTPAFLLGDDMFGGDWTVVDGKLRAKVK